MTTARAPRLFHLMTALGLALGGVGCAAGSEPEAARSEPELESARVEVHATVGERAQRADTNRGPMRPRAIAFGDARTVSIGVGDAVEAVDARPGVDEP